MEVSILGFFPRADEETGFGVFYQVVEVMGPQFWKADGRHEVMLVPGKAGTSSAAQPNPGTEGRGTSCTCSKGQGTTQT